MRSVRRGLSALVGLLLAGAWIIPAHADATRDAQWHLNYLHIPEAQQQANNGEGITVGLLDSGIDASHPDLAGSIRPGINTRENTGDARTDPDGHGTAMAGLIVGHGASGNGVQGIAPKAKILPVRAVSGQTDFNSSADIAKGMRWVIERGAKVVSVSIAANDITELKNAVEAAVQADIVVVAGVGNAPRDAGVRSPAAYDGVVAVGGVDRNGNHAAISVTGEKVLISAPATDIMTTRPGGKYGPGTGTSDATAIVAGVVALIRAKYPKLTAPQVIERLTATAVDKGAPGRDPEYGYGIVNPLAALSPNFKPSATPSAAPTDAQGNRDQAGNESDHDPARWPYVVAIVACVILVVAGAIVILVLVRRRRRTTPPPDPSYTMPTHWPPTPFPPGASVPPAASASTGQPTTPQVGEPHAPQLGRPATPPPSAPPTTSGQSLPPPTPPLIWPNQPQSPPRPLDQQQGSDQ